MQEQPLYTSNNLGSWIKVYTNRVEFNSGGKHQSIPLNQIASIQLAPPLFMLITLETTGGQKYKIPTNHKKAVQRAIYDAQSRLQNASNATPAASTADEIAKLYDLMQRGAITSMEFERRKNQLLR